MQTSFVRFLLSATLLAAGAGAAFWTWTLVQHIAHVEQRGVQTGVHIDRLQLLLDEVAEQEMSYAASSILDPQALDRVASVLQEIAAESTSLLTQSLAADAPAAGAVAKGSSAFVDVVIRTRENAAAGLDLMAADLLLTESHQLRRAMQQDLRALRTAEASAVSAARSADMLQVWASLSIVALLLAWALIRWSRAPTVPAPAEALVAQNSIIPPAHERLTHASASSVDLVGAAELCTAIGRARTEADLQELLERSATLLGARGIVIWMAAGEELFAAAAHGYDLRGLSATGPIGRSSESATAAAWRTGRLQTLPGDSTSKGAVVAPMLGPDRCIGALAVEIAAGADVDTATQAVTMLLAAQLAAVLTAWPAGSSATTADVLPFERASGSS